MKPPSGNTSEIDIAYVADLARIDLTDEEKTVFQDQLDRVIDYVRHLEELDVEGIEPTAHAAPRYNVLRADEPAPSIDRRAMLDNAPATTRDQVRVPKILENS